MISILRLTEQCSCISWPLALSRDFTITAESELSDHSDATESTESESKLQSDCVEKTTVLLDKLTSPKTSELALKRRANPPKGEKQASGSSH